MSSTSVSLHPEPTAPRSSLSRRAALVGACGTCVAALAGCANAADTSGYTSNPVPVGDGGSSADSSTDRSTDRSTEETEEPSSSSGVVDTADVPVGGGLILAAQQMVVTQPTRGEFKAFSTTCTHQGCAVTTVEDGEIGCACHGSTFSVEDGAPTGGPATEALEEMDIVVDGDTISMA